MFNERAAMQSFPPAINILILLAGTNKSFNIWGDMTIAPLCLCCLFVAHSMYCTGLTTVSAGIVALLFVRFRYSKLFFGFIRTKLHHYLTHVYIFVSSR